MSGLRIKLIIAGILGGIAGFAIAFVLIAMTYDPILQETNFLFERVWIKVQDYFVTKGRYSSIYFKLMGGCVAGIFAAMLAVIMLTTAKARKKLKAIYDEFDLNGRYVVRQRKSETLLFAILLLGLSGAVLIGFRLLHAGIESTASYNPFPIVTVLVTFFFSVSCVFAGMLAMCGYIRYGRYSSLPIELKAGTISFFESFNRLPVFAIDQPVTVELEHAEIDFDSQTGKGSLYVSNMSGRVVISPKLDFVNGSFDELADYLEQFAVEEDED